MSLSAILFVSIGAVAGLLVLLSYAPLHSTFFGHSYSPKLIFAKLVAPFDIGITLVLILGTIIGITVVTGIGMVVFNVATGIGLSIGSFIVRKLLAPRWRKQYNQIVAIRGL